MWQGSCPSSFSRIEPDGYLPTNGAPGFGALMTVDSECSTWNKSGLGIAPLVSPFGTCSTWNKSSFQNVKYGTGSSPGWISILEKSIDLFNSRGGVPVFSRPNSNPISRSDADKPIAAASPARPPDCLFSPMCIRPFKNVPVVTITGWLWYWTSKVVSTP